MKNGLSYIRKNKYITFGDDTIVGGYGNDEEITPTAVAKCCTAIGALNTAAKYSGQWNDADYKAQHQDSRGWLRWTQETVQVAKWESCS